MRRAKKQGSHHLTVPADMVCTQYNALNERENDQLVFLTLTMMKIRNSLRVRTQLSGRASEQFNKMARLIYAFCRRKN
ncbi:MAG: hypothetical protein NTZ67_01035 [Gammaproteobacteria bacterium]|nr:hypothetical protein [Gammaproteobacteria bacterium]